MPGCIHYYHADCIDEWLKINVTCPTCRNDIREALNMKGDEAGDGSGEVEIEEEELP